jgi:ribosomal protein L19E
LIETIYHRNNAIHFVDNSNICKKTRTKTSIRYAKENDKERKKERERKKGRRRDIERM